jgi:hypothetical protein
MDFSTVADADADLLGLAAFVVALAGAALGALGLVGLAIVGVRK